MSPILPGLSMTLCRMRHRWDIRAKPRVRPDSAENAAARSRINVQFPAAGRPFHWNVHASAGAFVSGIGQGGQAFKVRPQSGRDVLAGGGGVARNAVVAGFPDG